MSRARVGFIALLFALAALALLWTTRPDRAPRSPEVGDASAKSDAFPAAQRPEDESPAGTAPDKVRLRRDPYARLRQKGEPGEPVAIEGRVVDEGREPVAGATVSLRVPELAAVDTVSGTDGRFRLEAKAPQGVEPSDAGGLYAKDKDGGVGFARLYLVGGDAGAGEGPTIELRPAASLVVRVIDEVGAVGGARVVAWVGPDEGVGESGVRAAEATTNAEGKAEFPALPADAIALLAIAPDGRRARSGTRVTGPDTPPVVIEMEDRKEYRLHVTAGRPPAAAVGARVEIGRIAGGTADPAAFVAYDPPLEIAPTDAEGVTRATGLPPGDRPTLRVTLADGTQHLPSVRAYHWEWEVSVLGPRSACDWPVVARDGPVPPDGVEIRFSTPPEFPPVDLPRGRMSGSVLHIEGLPRSVGFCVAQAPDGSVATLRVRDDGEDQDPVSFHPVRRFEVHLVEEGVGPMAGAGLLLRDDGGHDMTSVVETDATGKAVLETPYLLHLDEFPVYVSLAAGYPDAVELVRLDAKNPDAPMTVTVPREREATLTLVVDGQPVIPPSLTWGWWDASHVKVTEDPKAGSLVVRYRASVDDKAVPRLSLAAPGFKKASASLPKTGDERKSSQEVRLERTGALHVRVRRAKGAPLVLQLERRDDAGVMADDGRDALPGVATTWKLLYRPAPVESGDVVTFDPVEPGLYRMRDATSGVVTAPFEVFASGAASEVPIDLSDLVRVKGRVSLREGTSFRDVRVVVAAYGIDFYDGFLPGKGVAKDGTFELWLPATREPMIHAERVGSIPKAEGPPVVVTGPKSDLVLTLGD